MDTIIWIFRNIMPWVGVWFTAMTVIFLIFATGYALKKRNFDYYDITGPAIDDNFHIIVSLVPMYILAAIALTIVGISRIPSLVRRARKKIDFIRFH